MSDQMPDFSELLRGVSLDNQKKYRFSNLALFDQYSQKFNSVLSLAEHEWPDCPLEIIHSVIKPFLLSAPPRLFHYDYVSRELEQAFGNNTKLNENIEAIAAYCSEVLREHGERFYNFYVDYCKKQTPPVTPSVLDLHGRISVLLNEFDQKNLWDHGYNKILPWWNLDHVSVSGKDHSEIDFTGATMESSECGADAKFENAQLPDAQLPDAQLPGMRCYGGNWKGANLARTTVVYGVFINANFQGANFQGSIFSEGTMMSELNLEAANLKEANLGDTSLYMVNLKGANLVRANLKDAKFALTDLSKTIFHGCEKFAQCCDGQGFNTLIALLATEYLGKDTSCYRFFGWGKQHIQEVSSFVKSLLMEEGDREDDKVTEKLLNFLETIATSAKGLNFNGDLWKISAFFLRYMGKEEVFIKNLEQILKAKAIKLKLKVKRQVTTCKAM